MVPPIVFWALAAGLIAAWVLAARAIIRLRTSWVRVDTLTGKPLSLDELDHANAPATVRVQNLASESGMRYAGSMVRAWDRLSGRQRRSLELRHRWLGRFALVALVAAVFAQFMVK